MNVFGQWKERRATRQREWECYDQWHKSWCHGFPDFSQCHPNWKHCDHGYICFANLHSATSADYKEIDRLMEKARYWCGAYAWGYYPHESDSYEVCEGKRAKDWGAVRAFVEEITRTEARVKESKG